MYFDNLKCNNNKVNCESVFNFLIYTKKHGLLFLHNSLHLKRNQKQKDILYQNLEEIFLFGKFLFQYRTTVYDSILNTPIKPIHCFEVLHKG